MRGNSPKGTSVGVSVMIHQMPENQVKKGPSVEEKVRNCIERIDNGCGTEVDFLTLKKLKAAIQSRDKITPRMKNILDMMEPVIQRFGYYY
jgi:hypothetical protein